MLDPRATIVIVTFQHRQVIGRCLEAVLATITDDDEVVVVDNASTDGTADIIASFEPRVALIRSSENLGFAVACNRAVRTSRARAFVFLNPDTQPRRGWLDALLEALVTLPSAGLVGPKLLQSQCPALIDAVGISVHVSGIPTSRGWGEPESLHRSVEEVASTSGACFAVSSSLFRRLSGFDERIHLYLEDMDLGLRARLAGRRCLITPSSEVLHDHPPGIWARKLYFIERNRWWIILKLFRARTLLALLPVLVIAEVVAWVFALVRGPAHLSAKWHAWVDLLRWLPHIPAARREAERSRVISDLELLSSHDTRLPFGQAAGGLFARLGERATTGLFAVARLLTDAIVDRGSRP